MLLLMYFRKTLEIDKFCENKSDKKATNMENVHKYVMCQDTSAWRAASTTDRQDKSWLSQKLAAQCWYGNSFTNKTRPRWNIKKSKFRKLIPPPLLILLNIGVQRKQQNFWPIHPNLSLNSTLGHRFDKKFAFFVIFENISQQIWALMFSKVFFYEKWVYPFPASLLEFEQLAR